MPVLFADQAPIISIQMMFSLCGRELAGFQLERFFERVKGVLLLQGVLPHPAPEGDSADLKGLGGLCAIAIEPVQRGLDEPTLLDFHI
jgi:hypothetical protein